MVLVLFRCSVITVIRTLEFPSVAEGGYDGEDGELFEVSVLIPPHIVGGRVNQIGVLVVIEVVDTDVDGTLASFEIAVEVYAEVHAVVVRHTVVVTAADIRGVVVIIVVSIGVT